MARSVYVVTSDGIVRGVFSRRPLADLAADGIVAGRAREVERAERQPHLDPVVEEWLVTNKPPPKRRPSGADASAAKARPDVVRAIRRWAAAGYLTASISERTGLSWSAVKKVIARETWREVSDVGPVWQSEPPRSRASSSRRPGSPITADQVRAMRALHKAGATVTEIADEFGLSVNAASQIVRRVTWRHVK